MKTTLIALWLALNSLEAPLSPDEQAAFNKIGKQLKTNLDAWNLIEKGLMKVISDNTELHQLYQDAKNKIDALEGNLPLELLPTSDELKQVLPPASQVEKRPWFEGNAQDSESQEILNASIKILTSKDPAETTNKLGSIQKIQQFIKERFQK